MKTSIKNFIFLCGIIVISSFNCSKTNLKSSEQKDVSGMVLFQGDPAVDGCGWLIKIDTMMYSPINLSANFQKDSLKVILGYERLNSTWNCGWRIPGYYQIKIINIQKIEK
jgi:hypothetical protein